MLSDDIVQEMYLYFHDKQLTVNDFYVKRKIYHIFIDHTRKIKPISIEALHYIQDNTCIFEPSDEEKEMLETFESLTRTQRDLIEEHIINDKSLRQIQREYPLINYGFAYRQIKEAKEIIINGTKKDR